MINDDIFAMYNKSYNKCTNHWTIQCVKIYKKSDKSK